MTFRAGFSRRYLAGCPTLSPASGKGYKERMSDSTVAQRTLRRTTRPTPYRFNLNEHFASNNRRRGFGYESPPQPINLSMTWRSRMFGPRAISLYLFLGRRLSGLLRGLMLF